MRLCHRHPGAPTITTAPEPPARSSPTSENLGFPCRLPAPIVPKALLPRVPSSPVCSLNAQHPSSTPHHNSFRTWDPQAPPGLHRPPLALHYKPSVLQAPLIHFQAPAPHPTHIPNCCSAPP